MFTYETISEMKPDGAIALQTDIQYFSKVKQMTHSLTWHTETSTRWERHCSKWMHESPVHSVLCWFPTIVPWNGALLCLVYTEGLPSVILQKCDHTELLLITTVFYVSFKEKICFMELSDKELSKRADNSRAGFLISLVDNDGVQVNPLFTLTISYTTVYWSKRRFYRTWLLSF